MARFTFRGGVIPAGHKEPARDVPLREMTPKREMVFLLGQHIGKPSCAVVKKGDPVLTGQIIAEADGFVSANIACSCSGRVKALEKRQNAAGSMMDAIVVENDGEFRTIPGFGTVADPPDSGMPDGSQIRERVQQAGVIGLGGEGYPTHVKLTPKEPDKIRCVIANGAECEPWLTCNDQLMRSCADAIADGLAVMLSLFPNAEGVIAVEKNKPEAAAAMEKAVDALQKGADQECAALAKRIRVLTLEAKYPLGGEHSLIRAVAGVDYPITMLPEDVGCLVENVGTIYAIQRAVRFREPLIQHVMSVTGDAVSAPGNFWVREGTCFEELLEEAGGVKKGIIPKKALAGGPMTGISIGSLSVPVQKNNNALLVLAQDMNEKAQEQMTSCLRCGRCSTVCPMGLMPQMMAEAAELGDLERYEKKLYGLECISCGSCTYTCPARRPLTQVFMQTRAEIMLIRRTKAAGGET